VPPPILFRRIDMTRHLLVLLAAAGCGQDFDLGSSRVPLAPGGPEPLPPSIPGCAPDDPALLKAPPSCLPPTDDSIRQLLTVGRTHAICIVDGRGSSDLGVGGSVEPRPNCPFGVYWSLERTPVMGSFEAAVSVRRGSIFGRPDDWAAAEPVPSTIEVSPDVPAFFVRFDPRLAQGPFVGVALDFSLLFPDTPRGNSPTALWLQMADDPPIAAGKGER
jgi:hypothetical protein